ncbi:TraB/GumN family protein [Cellulophaga sp. Hel_I_12]|uniref:TraB/GumN family protein n=1 Tax=Cellulophaga sp. Hel_I_12 TaxID=1249972 RepID=UPI00064794E5|nr:TraB/GumN family protein [Cellulophaga sp. Hel_I_12]
MRLLLTLLILLLFSGVYAQEKNSLLWEISGNGLEQSSYLYGTMHVSKKIAFRLDDVFYEALAKSDVIALESNPNTWLDNDMTMGFNFGESFMTKDFYSRAFELSHPEKDEIAAYLGFDDQMVNGMLYRTDEYSQNFEEDTYLDMFIYQAGAKFGKPIVALEDVEESSILVGRASFNAYKEKPAEWLQKKLQQKDYVQLVQDAYRERNIDLLDSIDQGLYTEHYLRNMLYIRNENMVKKLDSVLQKAKVFTGIGAAHLPGKLGVIELLRAKGYTVQPLRSKTGQNGSQLKSQFETKVFQNRYTQQSVDDVLFSILLPNKLYPVAEFSNTFYISPDVTNGSFFSANRIPTFSHLKNNKAYTIDDIDELLFENIPGKIIQKTRITRNGVEGIDIKNILKNGAHQRYQIYITPLEIIIFKMGGHDDYVKQYGDTIFNSIQFKKPLYTIKETSSSYKDFEVDMPAYTSFPNVSRSGNRLIQGFDSIHNTYRFLKKVTLHDYNFIEEDTFELKQIQRRFYKKLNLKASYNSFKNNHLESSAVLDTLSAKKLHLYTTLQGEAYYLLGMVTTDSTEAETYFNSLQLTKPRYPEKFKKVKDTALYFTTISNVKPPPFVANSTNFNKKELKEYNGYNKKTVYQNNNNEAIAVQLNKAHDFLMFPSIDSIWSLRKKLYRDKTFKIINEVSKTSPKGYQELQITLVDTASTRGILIKNVLKDGLLYEIKAVIDTTAKPSKFITDFYDHFTPMDTLIGKSLLTDKSPEFFKALRNNDSIALNGYPFINFDTKHIDSLKYYISEFEFKEPQKTIQAYLIQELAEIDTSESIEFYTNFYEQSYNNSTAQAKVLQAIAQKKTHKAAQQLLDLMAVDLPLVSSSFEIYQIFKPYMDSLPLAKKLYPKILDYSTIEEYKSPIFSLLAKLKSEKMIKPKIYKKYKNQILNDAKIQLKRQLGKAPKRNTNSYLNTLSGAKNTAVLEDYIQLLYPFIREKEVQLFFDKLDFVTDADLKTSKAALLASERNEANSKNLMALAKALESRNLLFKKLETQGQLAAFPEVYKTQKSLAEAQLFENKNLVVGLDSIEFVAQKIIQYRDKTYIGYAYKFRKHEDDTKNFKMYLAVYDKAKKLQSKPFYKNNGYRIEDTDTQGEILSIVIEEFMLRDRKRAEVYRENQDNSFGY